MTALPQDVAIIGGGVIGATVAWRAAQRGLSVTVLDDERPPRGSWAAAGMLAPVTEARPGEESLLALNVASAAAYPAFVAELEDLTGIDVGYRPSGTLVVAGDGDDAAYLAHLHATQQRFGLTSERLTPAACREQEPLLAPVIRGGLLVPGDHQVNNRRLLPALRKAAVAAGVTWLSGTVAGLLVDGGRVMGVVADDGMAVGAGTVVLAAGSWSRALDGVPSEVLPPVRPVKGQILRLHTDPAHPVVSHIVRGIVSGSEVYVVPRAEGEVVVGATVEEQGFDTSVTVGAVHDLLRDARHLLPALAEAELVECHAGLRPGSPDNGPLLGRSAMSGLVMATGHYRNGVLLAPITAEGVVAVLTDEPVPETVLPFSARRFLDGPVAAEVDASAPDGVWGNALQANGGLGSPSWPAAPGRGPR